MDLDEQELKATRKLLGLDQKSNKQQNYDDNDYLIAREECIEYNNVEEDINELKILLFQDRLTSYGKRKMVDYYESEIERQKQINKELKQKINDLDIDLTTVYIKGVEDGNKKHINDSKNAELREKVKELEKESRETKKKYLALLLGQFPDTTETYKKYKKELDKLLEDK